MSDKIVFRSCACGAHEKCIKKVWGVACDCRCHKIMVSPGSECTFPNCECENTDDGPSCEDYEISNEMERLIRIAGGKKCPVHLVEEPCPTCQAYIAAGL